MMLAGGTSAATGAAPAIAARAAMAPIRESTSNICRLARPAATAECRKWKERGMKAHYARLLAVFAGFGLAAPLVQSVHAQTKPPVYENPAGLFRVIIVVHAISSDWHETFKVNPEYPSFDMCEAERADLVEDFLQILKKRYLQ